jgi:iduronate 2-sulfatase
MARSSRPNVLFVITHDISPRLGCYGDPYAVTPRLNALAGSATRFDRHYCQWPLCGPSRASLFSGLRPQHTRRHDNRPFWKHMRDRQPAGYATMGEAFKRAGYRSECIWHALHAYETDPRSWSSPAWFPPVPPGPWWASDVEADELRYWHTPASFDLIRRRLEWVRRTDVPPSQYHRRARGPAVEAADVPDNAYTDGKATDRAVGLLGELAQEDRPFFVAVGYEAPHLPWTAPRRDFDAYDPDRFVIPADTPPAGSPAWVVNDKEPTQYYTTTDYDEPWAATPEQARELMHGHYASITYLDRQVGRLLDALDQHNLVDRTLVVFTSDHGFHIGEHGYWGKHTTWDRSFHCPLIVRAPGQRRPHAVATPTEHVDLLPTLCSMAQIDTPAGLDGQSILDAAGEATVRADNAAFSYRRRLPGDGNCRYFDCFSVRTARHRLNIFRDDTRRETGIELFDYVVDPAESRNHAGEAGLVGVEQELRTLLAPHIAEIDADVATR